MKRFASIILVIAMLFTLAVSVAAEESPTPVDYYKINTDTEGSGSVTISTNKVEKDTDGTVTLTATNDEGFFTYWIIDGNYRIVDGSLTDSVITIVPESDIDAVGSFSVDKDYLTMTVECVPADLGKGEVDIPKVKKGTDTVVTFTATETGGDFIEWKFDCAYALVSGSLTSEVVKIIPYTDVHGTAYFKAAPTPGKQDDGKTSPKTGDPLMYLIPLMALALGAAVVAAKKLRKD